MALKCPDICPAHFCSVLYSKPWSRAVCHVRGVWFIVSMIQLTAPSPHHHQVLMFSTSPRRCRDRVLGSGGKKSWSGPVLLCPCPSPHLKKHIFFFFCSAFLPLFLFGFQRQIQTLKEKKVPSEWLPPLKYHPVSPSPLASKSAARVLRMQLRYKIYTHG